MDYESKYKNAFERARKIHEYSSDLAEIKRMEHIFPELRESEDDRIRGAIIDHLKDYNLTEWAAWLEKQAAQKPVDKVEPKFNVGDWIISETSNLVYHVDSILCKRYYLSHNGEIVIVNFADEQNYHLWSIEDAKPGDVLVSQYNKPFIYNGNYNDYRVGAYCGIDTVEEFFIDACTEKYWTNNESIKPATKEQHDMLFQKMHESGYEWDVNNKELNKIHIIDEGKAEMDYCFTKMMNGEKVSSSEEDEEYNGEDYGIDSLYHAQRILEKTLGKVDGYQTDDGILSHKCAITAIKKLYEQKPAWTEEDRTMAFTLMRDVDQMSYVSKEGKNERIGWLNSLDKKFALRESAWSEEDEYMLNETIQHLEELIRIDKAHHLGCDVQYYQRDIDWLKFLKQKIGG